LSVQASWRLAPCAGVFVFLLGRLGGAACAGGLQAQARPTAAPSPLPSETPARFTPRTDSFDYERREVMIPMRDGVKLHTVILLPSPPTHLPEGEGKGVSAKRTPILLTRTPYSADRLTSHAESAHLGPVIHDSDHALAVIL